jgi:hypothetical protein
MEQPAHGLEVWMQPLVPLRSGDYDKWVIEHLFVSVPAQAIVAQRLTTFQEFPPRQKPGGLSIDRAMDMLDIPQPSARGSSFRVTAVNCGASIASNTHFRQSSGECSCLLDQASALRDAMSITKR